MTDPLVNQMRIELSGLNGKVAQMDHSLAALQGSVRALDFVVHCLLDTHPNLEDVRRTLGNNAPHLLQAFNEHHPTGAAIRSVLTGIDGFMAKAIAHREKP